MSADSVSAFRGGVSRLAALLGAQMIDRRSFLHEVGAAAAAPWFLRGNMSLGSGSPPPADRQFTLNLVASMIGVDAKTQADVNAFAHRHGFESVEARGEELARMSSSDLERLRTEMASRQLVWGAASLPTAVRADAATYADAIGSLPALAKGLQQAGVTRLGTWVSPGSDTDTYLQNFKRHVARVGEIARILGDHDVRLGLEYIGTPTLRRRRRYAFIHSMAEMKELIAEISVGSGASGGVGFVLDTWHWFTAGEQQKDLLTLANAQIVAVDLNDAPAGIPLEEQQDNQRELPCATGVIDVAAFVGALRKVGYDGPARAEPFNKTLNALPDDEAGAKTIAALKCAAKP